MPRAKPSDSKKKKRAVMQNAMYRYKHGQLHSGSKSGPTVRSRKQAIAIALHESGQSRQVGRNKSRRKLAQRKR